MTNHSYDIRWITQEETYLQRFTAKSLYFFKTYNEQNQCKEQYQYWDISWNIRCKGLIIRVKAGETNYGIQYGRVVSIFC